MDHQPALAAETSRRPSMEAPEASVPGKPICNRASDRTCMCCGRPFHSEGWHNRLCIDCRKRS